MASLAVFIIPKKMMTWSQSKLKKTRRKKQKHNKMSSRKCQWLILLTSTHSQIITSWFLHTLYLLQPESVVTTEDSTCTASLIFTSLQLWQELLDIFFFFREKCQYTNHQSSCTYAKWILHTYIPLPLAGGETRLTKWLYLSTTANEKLTKQQRLRMLGPQFFNAQSDL